ncbi:MAG TPA: hypothetical protein VFU82_03670 [Gammaproteobacteria bacterium]|nr:hypothetical protein [Gammaproteobacteria bacterium]
MLNFLKAKLNRLMSSTPLLALDKVLLKDNLPLSDDEYRKVSDICDIFIAISQSAGQAMIAPPKGGVFWDQAKPTMGPFEIYNRKNRAEINHLFLLFNAFRDFCALAYEYEAYTPKPDYWVRRYQQLTQVVDKRWHAALPARFGEIGWCIDGLPVNRWTSVNQDRINVLSMLGITAYLETLASPRILEIGAGSGELAYTLCKALPSSSWYDIDLLGCLIYSVIQMSVNLPERNHYIYVGDLPLPENLNQSFMIRSAHQASLCHNANVYIPHFLAEDFRNKLNIHFAYNTYSFGEMPKEAVEAYADLLSGFLLKEGVLYEQNGYFPERGGDNAENILAKQFNKVSLPKKLNGQWLPNGPTGFWDNNGLGDAVKNMVSSEHVSNMIDAFKEATASSDITYPNELMWPKVYELIDAHQNVSLLYPWKTVA